MRNLSVKLIPPDVLERSAAVLRVLGHPHRLRIVELLLDRRLTVGELAEEVGIAPNACSQHLNMMRAHGILRSERNGKSIYYEVDNPNAVTLIGCIREHGM